MREKKEANEEKNKGRKKNKIKDENFESLLYSATLHLPHGDSGGSLNKFRTGT
jgi:hypothetical protein